MVDEIKAQLLEILDKWSKGVVNEREVHELAESLYDKYGWHDYPESDPRSIVFAVLSYLEVLNYELVCEEDIPEIMAFLNTPPGKEIEAWERWKTYWDSIDYEKRKAKLAGNPYYAT